MSLKHVALLSLLIRIGRNLDFIWHESNTRKFPNLYVLYVHEVLTHIIYPLL